MSVGLLILRLVVGALFFGHGTQKLFGWFGGHGLDGTGGFFESLRYRNGREMALVAGLAHAGDGGAAGPSGLTEQVAETFEGMVQPRRSVPSAAWWPSPSRCAAPASD